MPDSPVDSFQPDDRLMVIKGVLVAEILLSLVFLGDETYHAVIDGTPDWSMILVLISAIGLGGWYHWTLREKVKRIDLHDDALVVRYGWGTVRIAHEDLKRIEINRTPLTELILCHDGGQVSLNEGDVEAFNELCGVVVDIARRKRIEVIRRY